MRHRRNRSKRPQRRPLRVYRPVTAEQSHGGPHRHLERRDVSPTTVSNPLVMELVRGRVRRVRMDRARAIREPVRETTNPDSKMHDTGVRDPRGTNFDPAAPEAADRR